MQVMRLFGKKANQQSVMADVPPELRPYYREQAVAARVRRTMVRVLASLAVLAILAGGGTWTWLHRHSIKFGAGSAKRPAATQQIANQDSTTPQSGGTNGSTTPPSGSSDGNTNSGTSGSGSSSGTNDGQAPAPSTPQPASTSSDSAPQSSSSSTPPAPHTSPQPAAPVPIPNTGPGSSVLVIGIVMAVAGVAVCCIYQKRTIRS